MPTSDIQRAEASENSNNMWTEMGMGMGMGLGEIESEIALPSSARTRRDPDLTVDTLSCHRGSMFTYLRFN